MIKVKIGALVWFLAVSTFTGAYGDQASEETSSEEDDFVCNMPMHDIRPTRAAYEFAFGEAPARAPVTDTPSQGDAWRGALYDANRDFDEEYGEYADTSPYPEGSIDDETLQELISERSPSLDKADVIALLDCVAASPSDYDHYCDSTEMEETMMEMVASVHFSHGNKEKSWANIDPNEMNALSQCRQSGGKRLIGVGFLGSFTDFQRNEVIKHAEQWNAALVNENFQLYFGGDVCNGQHIRVAFNPRFGNQSAIGINARGLGKNTPTMNIADVNRSESEKKRRIAIQHEFGHALGLLHEHGHPDLKLKGKWNKEKVIKYFVDKYKWTKRMVENEIFLASIAYIKCTNFDSNSIMNYPIKKGWRTDNIVANPERITQNDEICISKIYSGL